MGKALEIIHLALRVTVACLLVAGYVLAPIL